MTFAKKKKLDFLHSFVGPHLFEIEPGFPLDWQVRHNFLVIVEPDKHKSYQKE